MIDDLVAVMEAGDPVAFRDRLRQLGNAAQSWDPAGLTAGIEALAPLLPQLAGAFSKAGVLAGAMVELGGSPLPLRKALPRRAAVAMRMYALFPSAWAAASGGQPLPEPGSPPTMTEVTDILVAHAERRGVSARDATQLALSWFDTGDWLKAMITALAHKDFRASMSDEDRDQVRETAAAIADKLQDADWVLGLALVLDDEPLVVLDPASGRGFRLTMSGVGDNFQLHTLLADRLARRRGGVPGLKPPPRAWVTEATDGPQLSSFTDLILRRFRLFDGNGAYVYPEGRPADIAKLGETRVLVLHPPLGSFGWVGGRTYQHMKPTLTLDRTLDAAEAANWLARVAPANETDLMAINRE